MQIDEKWIRAHLPEECSDEPIDFFSGYYLDGLTVMAEGERGGQDTVVYRAESEEELRWWQLETVCKFVGKADNERTWRYTRAFAKDGCWYYIEHRNYDYNAIEDSRLPGFERFLRNLRFGFPPERWESKVRAYVHLMNFWYVQPHWDYDREKLVFIEISDSKEHDDKSNIIEEPRDGSVIETVDR